MANPVKTAVALGSFDGLHKGHKAVIACALSCKERGLVPTVLLFDSHPLLTITGTAPETLLQQSLRDEMLLDMGVEAEYIYFHEIRSYSPEEFFEGIILGKLNAAAVCCGSNYRFGRNGSGDCNTLRKLCEEKGIDLYVTPLVDFKGSPVSSTRIRDCVVDGNIREANEMLGYEFTYKATVKSGYQRGRLIGAPTINQYFEPGFVIPKTGVYASVTVIDDEEYPSVTNIGLRPTFENEDLRSETCIIGFDGNLYGQDIQVKLIDYIRGEMRFNSPEELSNRIAADAVISEKLFKERSSSHV